ncbi:MAG: IS110 family transposase, partial [Mesorhizobium sp.]
HPTELRSATFSHRGRRESAAPQSTSNTNVFTSASGSAMA